MSKPLRIALLLSALHLIAGNIVGRYSESDVLGILFFPYSFISGMCSLVGWDWLAYSFEAGAFIITTIPYYYLALLFTKSKEK
jgi:hypothetical protein